MIAVALDESPDDVRPWTDGIEFPVLIDQQHALTELYAISNVPTVIWIDERDRIVRPNGVAFGTDTFKDFTVLTPHHLDGRRDDVIALLKEQNVETRAYFHPPVHEQKFFQQYADRRLPRTEALSRKVITLPFYTTITEAEMDYVVSFLAAAERRLV